MWIKFTINFFINNLEVIKNILLSLASVFVIIYSVIFYIKIYLNTHKIDKINKEIEKQQRISDENEVGNIKGNFDIDLTDDVDQKKYKRKLEQDIQRLKREKEYLLEEISIFKIFKK